MASSNGYYEIVQLLISNGCKITSKSYKRETAIGVAQRLGDINMVKLLESYVENNGWFEYFKSLYVDNIFSSLFYTNALYLLKLLF